MLIHVGQDRSIAIDLRLAVWLAGVAGAVNAAGFRSMGFFSANMTGNVSSISDMLGIGDWWLASWFFALVVAFVAGAFVSGLLIGMGQRRGIRGIYAFSVVLEAALLVVVAGLDIVLPNELGGYMMLVGLSFVMGLQNAATTRISDARVRTSHVSGIATDIGLELAALTGLGRETGGSPQGMQLTRSRLLLHGATLAAFLLGGVTGVWGYGVFGPLIFVLVALLLLGLAVPALRKVYA